MTNKLVFNNELPINSKKLKVAFFSMVGFIVLCGIGYMLSFVFWDQFTYPCYSIKYQVNTTCGWPAKLQGWSLWLGVGFIVFLPFIFFMQDWKKPSLALTDDGLFINQQLMRNTLIPYANIEKLIKDEDGFTIHIKDPNPIIAQQIFIFKPFVKSNLQNKIIDISSTYTSGNLHAFYDVLQSKLKP